MRIKICGITNLDDARVAVEAGADYLGFILYDKSPRYVAVSTVRDIGEALRDEYGRQMPYLVGVFVNESLNSVQEKMQKGHLNLAQFSGDESPQMVAVFNGRAYKAIQPPSLRAAEEDIRDYAQFGPSDEQHPSILVDSYDPHLRGGTGKLGETELLSEILRLNPRMMLAGGLNPDNIALMVRLMKPFGVDVSSGVEAEKGRKDHQKVRDFIANARQAAEENQSE